MKIVRERPCQRRHHRVTAPLKVTLPSGEVLTATNWSLGGLRLDGVSSKLPKVDDVVSLVLELPFQGFDISFEVEGKITRSKKKKGMLGLEFTELSERAHDLMEHFINDLVRGQMATIEDTICRIDIPVTPISTKPDVNPSSEVPIKRWPMKTIAMSAFYICLGISVFTYLAILIYSTTMQLEIETAVVTSQLKTINMPVDGKVMPIRMNVGDIVNKGDEIAKIKSADLEAKLEAKMVEYNEKERQYDLAVKRYEIEAQRLGFYQVANQTDHKIAQVRLQAAQIALKAADEDIKRLQRINAPTQTHQLKLEDALSHQSEMELRLKEAELAFEKSSVVTSMSDRRHLTEMGFVADLDLLTLEIDAANSAMAIVHNQIRSLENKQKDLIIRAPFKSRIMKVADLNLPSLSQDQLLVSLEKREQPLVQAFMSQSEVMSVGLNDEASVFLPSTGESIVAKVVKIDRKVGHINAEYSNFVWRENDAKSALVFLELKPTDEQKITAGLPAVVIFSKRSTNQIYSTIGDVVSEMAEVFTNDNSV